MNLALQEGFFLVRSNRKPYRTAILHAESILPVQNAFHPMGQTKWAEFETWRLPWRPTWRQLYWKLLDSLWYNRQRPKKLRLGLTCHWQTGCTNHRADDEAVTSPAGSPNRTKKPLTPASVRRSFANIKKIRHVAMSTLKSSPMSSITV